jgi:putative ABC transport system permease protein
MFKNYIKIALRNIAKHKVYSSINIFGLAIGMALCMLILLFIQDELSYDGFFKDADRIYRIYQIEDHMKDEEPKPYMRIGGGVAIKLKSDFPETIDKVTRLWYVTSQGEIWTIIGDKRYKEKKVFVADSEFFNVFDFDFIAGDRKTALNNPNAVVITQAIAEKYFGDKDALGKAIKVDIPGTSDLKVTGIIKDIPKNSHMHWELLVSLPTLVNERNQRFFEAMYSNQFYTYILFKNKNHVKDLESKLPDFRNRHLNEEDKKVVSKFMLQNLKDIHIRAPKHRYTEIEPENAGSMSTIYIFGAIGLLTLIIACINFMNLSTARYANRAREVGLRKVVGSKRSQLISLFIGESIIISFIALPFAIIFASIGLPLFNNLSGKALTLEIFNNPLLLVVVIGILIFVGFFSGTYPAFFLSAFKPVEVLKGKLSTGSSSATLRKFLVVGQFIVSSALVASAVIILQQLDFMKNKELGFKKDHIVELPLMLPQAERVKVMEYLKTEYKKIPGILDVCVGSAVPGDIRGIVRARLAGQPEDQNKMVTQVSVGYDFIKTLGIKIVEGRDFSRDIPADSRESIVVNETAARVLGIESPVMGKKIMVGQRAFTVLGKFEDIHWEPKRREIFGMMFSIDANRNFKLIAKLNPKKMSKAIAAMKVLWDKNVPNRTFDHTFFEYNINTLYKSEDRLSEVVRSFTVLAIIIACLGLFGLASFTAEQRTKEIGIRKVLGASVSGVLVLLSKEYAKLILFANVIAIPFIIILMNKWLDPFYYKISIGGFPFIVSMLLVFVVAYISIGFQSVKAALANPVDAIKYE